MPQKLETVLQPSRPVRITQININDGKLCPNYDHTSDMFRVTAICVLLEGCSFFIPSPLVPSAEEIHNQITKNIDKSVTNLETGGKIVGKSIRNSDPATFSPRSRSALQETRRAEGEVLATGWRGKCMRSLGASLSPNCRQRGLLRVGLYKWLYHTFSPNPFFF